MAIHIELNLRLPNSPGALADVSQLLAAEHVNVLAMAVEASGQVRLIVDNHVRAGSVLRDRHHKVSERHIIVASMPNVTGALARVLRLAADAGVNIEYAYTGTADRGGTVAVVLGVDNAARASAATGL